MTTSYQLELGARLRDIRQQQGLTLQQVEERTGGHWKAVVVGSYERGDRAISVAKLADLASFYGVPVAELLPPTDLPLPARASSTAPVMIDLAQLEADREHDGAMRPLARYVRTIQLQRGDYNGRVITLRADDLQALGIVLGIEADDLVDALDSRGLIVQH